MTLIYDRLVHAVSMIVLKCLVTIEKYSLLLLYYTNELYTKKECFLLNRKFTLHCVYYWIYLKANTLTFTFLYDIHRMFVNYNIIVQFWYCYKYVSLIFVKTLPFKQSFSISYQSKSLVNIIWLFLFGRNN